MMRVLIVVLALCVAPFVVGAGQSAQGSNCDNGQGDEHRSDSGTVHAHQGQCVTTPPPSCATPQQSLGTNEIDGRVYDANTGAGLAGWCVDLTGDVTASVQTDASGAYSFTGLPDGTYLLCEEAQLGWTQVFPDASFGASCPSGFGWSFGVSNGTVAQMVNFGNVANP